MKRILIVDEDPTIRHLLSRFFTRQGFKACEASTSDEAIRLQKDSGIDLVITDLFTKDRNGLETIHLFRTESKELKIIALSGGYKGAHKGVPGFLKTARSLGADQTFRKPVDLSELLISVRQLLGSC
jgi:DNA-binding response OmpR family regulator